jgi:hypothetical protein
VRALQQMVVVVVEEEERSKSGRRTLVYKRNGGHPKLRVLLHPHLQVLSLLALLE